MNVRVETYLVVVSSFSLILIVLGMLSRGVSSSSRRNALGGIPPLPYQCDMSYVNYFTMDYLMEWLKSDQDIVKGGDSLFLFKLNDDITNNLFVRTKGYWNSLFTKNDFYTVVSLTLKKPDSEDFLYIHSYICKEISPDLFGCGRNGMWIDCNFSLKRVK